MYCVKIKHVSGKSFNISSMLIYFLMNITLHTRRKWQCKVFIFCCSLNCYRNICAVNYTKLVFLYQNNKLLLENDKRCLFSHWPAAFQFEILMTTFVELRVVAGRSRRRAGLPQAVSRRKMLIHTCHVIPCHEAPLPCCTVALKSRFQNGMVGAWQGRGMGMAWYVWIKHDRTV
jgi:hypothetical protein